MLKSFLLISIRSMWSKSGSALLNIICLALGVATCLFISNYIFYELSFDAFHTNANRLYRLETDDYRNQEITRRDAFTPFGKGDELKEQFSQVEDYFRLIPFSENYSAFLVSNFGAIERTHYVETAYYADNSILDLLNIEIIEKSESALSKTNTAAISFELAKSLFPDEIKEGQSILGKSVRNRTSDLQSQQYEITVVFEKLPINSHLHFDALFSTVGEDLLLDNSSSSNSLTYVLLRENADPAAINNQLLKQSIPTDEFITYYKSTSLYPLKNIHLGHQASNQPSSPTNAMFLIFLAAIGIIVLLLSTTNYVNNCIITALDRAKEIGIRKLLGVSPNQLRQSIYFESLFTNLIASVLGVLLFIIGQRSARIFIDVGYPVGYSSERIQLLALTVLAIILLTTIFTAGYPAQLLNSLKLTQALKGKNVVFQSKQSSSGARAMKTLLVFQLAMSMIFVSGAFAVYSQLNYLKEKDKRSIALEVRGKFPGLTGSNEYAADLNTVYLRSALEEGTINSFKISNLSNGQVRMRQYIAPLSLEGDSSTYDGQFLLSIVDHNYWSNDTSVFISGSNFSPKFGKDYNGVIINESALEAMKFIHADTAIGKVVGKYNSMLSVKGVIKNRTPDEKPMVYVTGFRYPTYFDITLNIKGNSAEKIDKALTQLRTDLQYDLPKFYFITRNFENQSKLERSLLNLFILFTCIAVFVACMGVYSLSSFTAQKRTKEMGLRKILGANVSQILYILIYDFMRLIFIGSIISIPLIVFGIRSWLNNYAYRIDLHPLLLAIPILTMTIIAVSIIIKQSWKTAVVSPLRAISR
ncbi:MAG: ABC transporter permease [Cytophagia bacterium]|nr:ABC transporter permease [Cytophagia bacterium]